MLKKNIIAILLMSFLSSSVSATILDQAEWLLKTVDRHRAEKVGHCVGHSLAASADFAILLFGWLDLMLENRINRAHQSRIEADCLATTKENLKKLIRFLKNVETAFLYVDSKNMTSFLENEFGKKFARAVNELRHPQESIADTITRIHLKNQAGDDRFKSIDISLDYYSTIRSSFCK